MFMHAIVAVDFSGSWPLLKQRLGMLVKWGLKKATLVHVLSSRYPAVPDETHRDHYEARWAEAAASLSERQAIDVDVELRTGEPGLELTLAAQSRGADLLLIGSQGHGRLRAFWLGNTVLEAARHADVPIWLEPVHEQSVPMVFDVMLLATDFSGAAEGAECVFGKLRSRFERVVIVTVNCEDGRCEPALQGVAAKLDAMCGRCPDAETRLLKGNPREQIASLVRDLPADLTVVGKRGRNAPMDLLLGSTAEAVCRHALRPVLLVPALWRQV